MESLPDAKTMANFIFSIEEERTTLRRKISDLEEIINIKNRLIDKQKLVVKLDKFKVHILSHLLEQYTEIKVSSLFEEAKNELHVHDYFSGGIDVFLHTKKPKNPDLDPDTQEIECSPIEEQEDIQKLRISVKKTKGTTFRTIKIGGELETENPQEQEERIKQIDEEIKEEIRESKMDVSYKNSLDIIEDCFQEVIKGKAVTKKYLVSMKETRNKLLVTLGLKDYILLTEKHMKRLEGILASKNFEKKKVLNIASQAFSSLDQRFLLYTNFHTTELEPDDIERFLLCLKVNMDHPKRYVEFSIETLLEKISNYSLCIFSMKELFSLVINPYSFSNIIYLKLPVETEEPYSFYTLEKFDRDGTRCWKMDCRLDDFCRNFADRLLAFAVHLYRRIYQSIFLDNTYRETINIEYPVLVQDCEQLMINILYLTKKSDFSSMVKTTIVQKCSHEKCTGMDRFNLTRDDILSRKAFHNYKDSSTEFSSYLRRMYDNISDEQVAKIIDKYYQG